MQQEAFKDELGIIEDARNKEATRALPKRKQQDLAIVSRGPAQKGRIQIGSYLTNSIVGEIDVEIVENNVVVTVRRADESYFGPVSLVVV